MKLFELNSTKNIDKIENKTTWKFNAVRKEININSEILLENYELILLFSPITWIYQSLEKVIFL